MVKNSKELNLIEYTEAIIYQDGKMRHYRTFYDETGITICRYRTRFSKNDDEYGLCKIDFTDSSQYDKVMQFLQSFAIDDNLTFTSQKSFWISFLNDSVDLDHIMEYFELDKNGYTNLDNQSLTEIEVMRNLQKYSDVIDFFRDTNIFERRYGIY